MVAYAYQRGEKKNKKKSGCGNGRKPRDWERVRDQGMIGVIIRWLARKERGSE